MLGKNIAIVGLGIAGGAALHSIYNQLKEVSLSDKEAPINKIVLYESGDFLFSGPAHRPDSYAEHLTNMEMSEMDVYADIDGGIHQWIKDNKKKLIKSIQRRYENGDISKDLCESSKAKLAYVASLNKWDDSVYLPRYIFGTYLVDVGKKILKDIKKLGVEVEVIKEHVAEITKLTNDKEGCNVITESKKSQEFSAVIVSTGHSKGPSPEGQIPAYYPQVRSELNKLLENSEVQEINIKIVGAGLTAIDMAKTLIEKYKNFSENHQNSKVPKLNIRMVSRNGILPRVRLNTLERKNKSFTLEAMKALVKEKQKSGKKISLQDLMKPFIEELMLAYKEYGVDFVPKSFADFTKEISPDGKQAIFQLGEELKMAKAINYLADPSKKLTQKQIIDKLNPKQKEFLLLQTVYRSGSLGFAYILESINKLDTNNLKECEEGDLIIFEKLKAFHMASVAPAPIESVNYLMQDTGSNITVSVGKVDEDYKNKNADMVVDGTGQGSNPLKENPLLSKLYEEGLVNENLKSTESFIFFAGINKLTTAIVNRSFWEGQQAGLGAVNLVKGIVRRASQVLKAPWTNYIDRVKSASNDSNAKFNKNSVAEGNSANVQDWGDSVSAHNNDSQEKSI